VIDLDEHLHMLEGRAHDKGFVDISEEEMKPLRRYMVNGMTQNIAKVGEECFV
jgi:hypothetical protein